MKKLDQSLSKYFGNLVLYLDDIEKILECFSEISNEVKIKTDEYELENIGEIEKIDSEYINFLEISTSNPYISLTFNLRECWFYSSTSSVEVKGLLNNLQEILGSKKRIVHPYIYFVLGIVSLTIGFQEISNTFISVPFFSFSILTIWWNHELETKYQTMIFLKRKKEVPSFIRRKKDDLILVFLSSVITAILTYAVMRYFE